MDEVERMKHEKGLKLIRDLLFCLLFIILILGSPVLLAHFSIVAGQILGATEFMVIFFFWVYMAGREI